jgi:hypothetical protein
MDSTRQLIEYHYIGRQEASVGKRTSGNVYAFKGDRHVCAAQRFWLNVSDDTGLKQEGDSDGKIADEM